jgi:hypothetical protein
MMKKLLALCVLLGAAAAPARAQMAPVAGEKGRFAAGVDAGATFPFGAGYDTGWGLDASFDYYVARLFAVRASAGYARSSTEFADPFTRASLLGSAVFQFENGALRPYARAGLGVYVVSPPVGATRTRVGVHAGGGLEWFFKPTTSLTGEILVHVLPSTEDRSTSALDLTVGIRRYF